MDICGRARAQVDADREAGRLDRASLDRMMAHLRARVLAEGRCGVTANASWCVGAWCNAASRHEWGAHASRLPWEPKG